MPWFIKTESFNAKMLKLSKEERQKYLIKHSSWIIKLREKGINITSGYLINEKQLPGGGGFLIVEANSFRDAQVLIEQDPMIRKELVNWNIHEWKSVVGEIKTDINEGDFS